MMRHVIGVVWVVIAGCQPAPEGEADALVDAEVDAVVADAAIVDAAWVGGLRPLPTCTVEDESACADTGFPTCRNGRCCAQHECLECLDDDRYCPARRPFCVRGQCYGCLTSDDCPPERPYCTNTFYHSTIYDCAQCASDEDCPPGTTCGGQLAGYECIAGP